MDGSHVFLAGTTATTLIRGIYEPGSQGVMGAWASRLGLDATGLRGVANANDVGLEPTLADSTSSIRAIRRALATAPLPRKLLGERPEVLVDKPVKRLKGDEFSTRLWSTPVPNGSFMRIDEAVSLCSPAFLFVQRAADLGLIRAIGYGNELCGLYSLDGSARGFNDHPAFATSAMLSEFLSSCKRGRGTQVARVTLKWVVDRCRSPKESDTYLLACLPREYGSYGIRERPRINGRVSVPEGLWYLTQVHSYEADLLWERARAVVEYDGSDHEAPEQRLRDDIKTHVLEEMGYLVIRITWDILRDPTEFDRRMRLLGNRLGMDIPLSGPDFVRKRTALRKELFGDKLR